METQIGIRERIKEIKGEISPIMIPGTNDIFITPEEESKAPNHLLLLKDDFLLELQGNNDPLFDELVDVDEDSDKFLIYFEEWKKKKLESYSNPKKEIIKREIFTPQVGKTLVSDFIRDMILSLNQCNTLFYRQADDCVVEYSFKKLRKLSSNRMISLLEGYCIPGVEVWNDYEKQWNFKRKSVNEQNCKVLIESKEFKESQKLIKHTLNCPIPFLKENKLYFPERGYNPDLFLYLDPDSPEIQDGISLEDAKKELISLYSEFCLKSENDLYRAIMSLITPFCRGLYSDWTARTPIYVFFANRERAGKDYCGGIRMIVYHGYAVEESPISTGKGDSNEELRKKIMSTVLEGKRLIHFANNKGHINNSVLEQISTARQISDRVLGKSKILEFDNELEISLSGNIGTTMTPDLMNRSQIVYLHLAIEDANSRVFNNPDLHGYLINNRGRILSCLYSLVKHWVSNGMKEGSVAFSSFPEWARVVGGIMEAAGWPNPIKCNEKDKLSLDNELEDMRMAFELSRELCGDGWITKQEFRDLIQQENLFGWFDYSTHNWTVAFAKIIDKYSSRELSGITMELEPGQKRRSRQKIRFIKSGSLGSLENETTTKIIDESGSLGSLNTIY